MNKLAFLEGYMNKEAAYWRNSSALDYIKANNLEPMYEKWKILRTKLGMGDSVNTSPKMFANQYLIATKKGKQPELVEAYSDKDRSLDIGNAMSDATGSRRKQLIGSLGGLGVALLAPPLAIPALAGGLGYSIYQGAKGKTKEEDLLRLQLGEALRQSKEEK